LRLVVLDTNVIISAGVSPFGASSSIVFDWVMPGNVQVVTSPEIVAEYREVAQRPKFRRYGFLPLWLDVLIEESVALDDPDPWPQIGPDPKDLPFLALAHASGAWLITGNQKHFPESIRNGVTVLSPTDYLAHLTRV
jgi:putative PIN family toxin of toxin-antitoxin system